MKVSGRLIAVLLTAGAALASLRGDRGDGEIVDTLAYFVSHHGDVALESDDCQPLSQTVEDHASYYVKWHPNAYEYHTWDDKYVYLKEDHTWADPTRGNRLEPYAMEPGVWMKRRMRVGEVVSMGANRRRLLYARHCGPTRLLPLSYKVILESHDKHFEAGGDLGVQDVIVLRYDYSRWTGLPDRQRVNSYEKFYYSREWGWIQWEQYEDDDLARYPPRLRTRVRYNRRAPRKRLPNLAASCNEARFVGKTLGGEPMPPIVDLTAGDARPVEIRYQNTGTSTWSSESDLLFALGAVDDDDDDDDGITWEKRLPVSQTVAPGETCVFGLELRAAHPGTYRFQWRMVLEDAEWFGEPSPPVTVRVAAAPRRARPSE